MSPELKCAVCGRQIEAAKPCPYNRTHPYTCDECCEECYNSEPFPCREYEARHPGATPATGYRTPGAAEQIFYIIKWALQQRACKINRLWRKNRR